MEHKCTLNCCEDCKNCKCKEKVKIILSCGHLNNVFCYLLNDKNNIVCQEKCNKILQCGHPCTGTCGKCLEGTLHVKCEHKCGRNLPCGHVCEQKCSAECLCSKKCPNICDHGYCDKKCCEICVDCVEKCSIRCKHSKCDNKCGELCSRNPCNKRCDTKMKCGHQCYGLCGERCPEVCRICNPELECFTNDLFYMSELDEDALLYKTQCGHLFGVEGLDHYFESQSTIHMYTCPRCKSLLLLESRYQNYIKKMFIDIQKIKKVSLDRNMGTDDNTFLFKSKEIINRILDRQYKKGNINIFDILQSNNLLGSNCNRVEYNKSDLNKKMPIIYNLCKNVFKEEKDLNSRKNTTYNLLTLAEKFMGIEYYVYYIKSRGEEKNEYKFLKNFNIIKSYFKDFEGQFNNFFFNDLRAKIDNMLYYSILKLNKNLNIYNSNNINDFNNIYGMNRLYYNSFNNNNYTKLKTPEEIMKGNFCIKLDLKDLYKDNNIDEQALNLLRTLGTTWYKCPNGHLYVVGECGGPMQTGICPECRSQIGGRYHQPAYQNSVVNLNNEMRNLNINNENRIRNPLLNQDKEAQDYMNRQHNMNQEHHMDPDIRDLIRQNPQMNNYYN